MSKENKKVTAKAACIKICEAVWSCKNPEQKKGVEKMAENYIRDYGDDNIGVTFIQIELARLNKMIEMAEARNKAMQQTQDALKKSQADESIDKANKNIRDIDLSNSKISKGPDGKAVITPIDPKAPKGKGIVLPIDAKAGEK